MFDYYREDAEQMAAQALVTNKAKGNSARGVDQNTVLEIMPQHSATPNSERYNKLLLIPKLCQSNYMSLFFLNLPPSRDSNKIVLAVNHEEALNTTKQSNRSKAHNDLMITEATMTKGHINPTSSQSPTKSNKTSSNSSSAAQEATSKVRDTSKRSNRIKYEIVCIFRFLSFPVHIAMLLLLFMQMNFAFAFNV